MTTLTLPQRNGNSHAEPWLTASVQTFFAGCNWEDNSATVQELKASAQISNEPLSLTLNVSQFFSTIVWEGHAIAAPPSPPPVLPSRPAADLTLDDFSDLF